MLLPDVKVWLLALRASDSDVAGAAAHWVEDAINGQQTVAVSDLALSAVIRIATSSRVFEEPASPAQALEFCQAVRSAPACRPARPSPAHWPLFADLVAGHRLRSTDVPDAWYAALALDLGATLVTLDRGFGRFAGLRVLDPLAG